MRISNEFTEASLFHEMLKIHTFGPMKMSFMGWNFSMNMLWNSMGKYAVDETAGVSHTSTPEFSYKIDITNECWLRLKYVSPMILIPNKISLVQLL